MRSRTYLLRTKDICCEDDVGGRERAFSVAGINSSTVYIYYDNGLYMCIQYVFCWVFLVCLLWSLRSDARTHARAPLIHPSTACDFYGVCDLASPRIEQAKEGYLQGQIGNPDGDDKPNKKCYDPRVWIRKASCESTVCIKRGLFILIIGEFDTRSLRR